RHREVVEDTGVAAELPPRPFHGTTQRLEAIVDAGEGEPSREPLPCVPRRGLATELLDRRSRSRAEIIVGELPAGGSDDPKALGHQASRREVEDARQELAPRE